MMFKYAIRLFLCASILTLSSTAGAQVRFLDRGQSGIGFGFGAGSGDELISFGGALSYVTKSGIAIQFGAAKISYDDEAFGEDGSGTSFAPGVEVGVVRPTESSNAGITAFGSYSFESVSSDALDELDWDVSGNALTLGIDGYTRIASSATLEMYPTLTVAYVHFSSKIEDALGESVEDDESNLAFGGSLAFLFDQKFAFSPSFMTIDGNTTWSIAVTMILPGS